MRGTGCSRTTALTSGATHYSLSRELPAKFAGYPGILYCLNFRQEEPHSTLGSLHRALQPPHGSWLNQAEIEFADGRVLLNESPTLLLTLSALAP